MRTAIGRLPGAFAKRQARYQPFWHGSRPLGEAARLATSQRLRMAVRGACALAAER